MKIEDQPKNNQENRKNFLLYTAPDGEVRLEVFLQDETLWLTQNAIAELFDVTKSTISEHLKNIYDSSELERSSTVRKFRTVQKKAVGVSNETWSITTLMPLSQWVIGSIPKGPPKFRMWAKTLQEYIIKGFVVRELSKGI